MKHSLLHRSRGRVCLSNVPTVTAFAVYRPRQVQQRRGRHDKRWNSQVATGVQQTQDESTTYKPKVVMPATQHVVRRPLKKVSTSHLLRTLLLGYTFSSPRLLSVSLSVMKWLVNSKSAFINPDKNPLVGQLVRGFIYNHFSAGDTPATVRKKVAEIKDLGFSGVILGFSREIVVDDYEGKSGVEEGSKVEEKCVAEWLQSNLETLNLIEAGDYMNIKYTGAGPHIGEALLKREGPPKEMAVALDSICQQAKLQGKRVWVDAEQQCFQATIDRWTIDLMRRHNQGTEAVVYNTIQAYLKASRDNILDHLQLAKAEGWTCGIKLVRGAYIQSDIRERIWDTKQQTDNNYNSIVRDILCRSYGPLAKENFPRIDLFVAGHNKESIHCATRLIKELVARGEKLQPVAFGQLQGMADEVSFDLVQLKESSNNCTGLCPEEARISKQSAPKAYKCLNWGSVADSMHFLMRRATENGTAVERMADGMFEARAELKRRMMFWKQVAT